MVVVGEALVFEEPNPLPGLIVDDITWNRVNECNYRLRTHADGVVYDLGPGRLDDIIDDASLFDRNYPYGLVARWGQDKRCKVGGILGNGKRRDVGTCLRWNAPVGNRRREVNRSSVRDPNDLGGDR